MKPTPLEKGIQKILKEFHLPTSFPKKVLHEVEQFPAEISLEEIGQRIDLRDEITVTIDGETAKDFDDAVSLHRLPSGHFLLKVSIADVSHYVKPGSDVDREAHHRGTSTYFPDRVIPMLPERLSNHLCSLVPDEDRLTFTAEMEFDPGGRRTNSRFYRSVIRSRARLTYTLVRKILVDKDPEALEKYRHLLPMLEKMGELSDLLSQRRRERGSLDFDLPEPLIEIDMEEGSVERIVKAERNKAHRLIEEFMIAANEAVAEFVTEQGQPMIYRIHEEPDSEKVQDLSALLHNLGYAVPFKKKVDSKVFASVIDLVRGKTHERLVNTILLRTMKQAIYAAKNGGHFGLASTCYTHFTSPIRRYPDLVVHRLLAGVLAGKKKGRGKKGDLEALERISLHCSTTERNSMKAEWASRDLASAIFMQSKIGETHQGIISDVTKFGFFVELTSFFLRGLVSCRNLKEDYYIFMPKGHYLMGRKTKKKYSVGMPVTITVKGINLDKRWVDFEI